MCFIRRFEDLPNKILLEYLKYLNALNLFYSFDDLNKRFCKLIRSTNLHLNFENVTKLIFEELPHLKYLSLTNLKDENEEKFLLMLSSMPETNIVILSTSEANGLCYIETAELDGETNLKVRQSLEEIQNLGDDIDEISNFDGEIECEPPNNNLNRFEENIKWKNGTYLLKNEKVNLRGSRLRNTQWIIGIVCYAGSDTKLMKNTNKAPFKRSHIDRLLDKIIIVVTKCAAK